MYDDDTHDTDGPATGDSTESSATRISDYQRRMAEIDRLGDEIAVLSAQIQAATYELLVRLREFDQREGWGHHGAKSCAHWLAWRTSLDPGAAREWVRVARALEHLPALSEAMRKGEVSYSKARALTRIATPETEAELVELARAGTAAHIEKIVRACRRYGPKEERDKERACTTAATCRSRTTRTGCSSCARGSIRWRERPCCGRSMPRREALYQKRARRASDRRQASGLPRQRRPTSSRPGQRRADALVLLAESALAGGLDPGTAGDRYQVVVHVDAAVLADPAEQGVSCLADGQHVSAETSRRVACDASKVVMTHAPDGSVLDVGRTTRTISPALRRALVNRDGGCRFPGCGQSRCDAHHVKHWADGGETSLDNTLLLCRFHHRLVHEEGFQLHRLADGEVEFRTPHGLTAPRGSSPAPPADRPVRSAGQAARGRRDRGRSLHRNAALGRLAAGSRGRGRVVPDKERASSRPSHRYPLAGSAVGHATFPDPSRRLTGMTHGSGDPRQRLPRRRNLGRALLLLVLRLRR